MGATAAGVIVVLVRFKFMSCLANFRRICLKKKTVAGATLGQRLENQPHLGRNFHRHTQAALFLTCGGPNG